VSGSRADSKRQGINTENAEIAEIFPILDSPGVLSALGGKGLVTGSVKAGTNLCAELLWAELLCAELVFERNDGLAVAAEGRDFL
jgi:hypothetical protein